MESLRLEPAKSTPLVDFNVSTRIFTIKGESYPENSFKFYEPILQWLDAFFEQVTDQDVTKLEISLPYINTSSSKCILMLLEKFEKAYQDGKSVVVNWYYDEENESEMECAQDFKEYVELEFNLIAEKGS
ncbi:DUF1987 domain-containing protein [Candidatus Symbiobacter mobilis]|uniref:SiaC family regulatory phosphoprotein domain-containing protein n=1 Tax=Candidatus Symbiobacter mobilis CR TaxID=946483 RepID=U5N951_9BURK|nr:DUF1987 domain-containing protein [Candidatus Symbiobacter mobilis]AGX87907.1 hypothetical protein Cenrod_1823 [Candidatus Symbiobacter mobilis CR]